ncbi:VOC family protein [Cupriavidus sp. D39]|uniref:VOC family protein n=1 Tax=Cupriavidus sp. D39 TaxID=2997877 RepID=UPI003B63F326
MSGYRTGTICLASSTKAQAVPLSLLRPPYGPWRWSLPRLVRCPVAAYFQANRARGLRPEAAPRDAEWGERYFHISDPDGHELSFAKLLAAA